SERAHMTLALMQNLLQIVRSRLPVEQQQMSDECVEMVQAISSVAERLDGASGPAAVRIRQRSDALCAQPVAPPVTPLADTAARYMELTEAVTATLEDLDTLIRDGVPGAREGLAALRCYLADRSQAE